MSTVEAAKVLGVTPQAVGSAIRSGLLTGRKIGRDWFIPISDFQRYATEKRPVGRPPKNA
jgi:excisionase family DNA binding protein